MVKRMLRGVVGWCAALCLLLAPAYAMAYGAPAVKAEIPAEIAGAFDAALLIDRNTKAALFEKETGRAFSPTGGAVNLMSAYIVLQEADLEQEIPITDRVNTLSVGVRKVDLLPGQRWLIKDLVAAMVLYGAQDASLILCEHVGDSLTGFVTLMNQYAQELGMKDTVYTNCLGAYSQGQTSTVSDLMLLSEAALANDTLREMLGKSAYDAVNGKVIRNRMEIMQEGRSSYDARIKGIGEGSTATTGTNTLLYAVDGGREWLFVGYTAIDDQRASEQNALAALDYVSGAYENLDVTSLVRDLLQAERMQGEGIAITPVPTEGKYAVSVEKSAAGAMASAWEGFALGALPPLSAAPGAGEAIGTVWLRYQERDILEIALLAGSETAPAQAEGEAELTEPRGGEDTQDQEIPVYSAEDWKGAGRENTFIGRYGSWIIIGMTTLLACVVLLAARYLRHKKH